MNPTYPISGTVVAASRTAPAPASQITYTVRFNREDGRPITMDNIVPSFNRWPDALVDTVPAAPGTPIHGYAFKTGGPGKVSYFIHVPENPRIAPCAGSNSNATGERTRTPTGVVDGAPSGNGAGSHGSPTGGGVVSL